MRLQLFALLTLGLTIPVSASAQEEGEPVPKRVSDERANEAREFWTQERLRQAEPYPVGEAGKPPKVDEVPPAKGDPARRPGSPPSQKLRQSPNLENFPSVPGEPRLPNPGPQGPTRPNGPLFPHLGSDGSLVAQLGLGDGSGMLLASNKLRSSYTSYPLSTMGKVFFTKDGSPYSCSAAVINTEGKSLVWTAGHCVAEQGDSGWHENWVFIPGYKNGNRPYGTWSARVKWTWSSWFYQGNRNFDLGAVQVASRDGQRIGNVTGTLGWMFNFPRDQPYSEFGYPGVGNRFNGQLLVRCNAPYSGPDGVRRQPGPRTSTNQCDFTAGASGGPWVVETGDCPNCYINSVNSWWWWSGERNRALQWAGPYHGRAAYRLYKAAQR